MTQQRNLYLLKHRGVPVRIFDDWEKIKAILEYSGSYFSHREISKEEAHLLRPDIADYNNSC